MRKQFKYNIIFGRRRKNDLSVDAFEKWRFNIFCHTTVSAKATYVLTQILHFYHTFSLRADEIFFGIGCLPLCGIKGWCNIHVQLWLKCCSLMITLI